MEFLLYDNVPADLPVLLASASKFHSICSCTLITSRAYHGRDFEASSGAGGGGR